MMNFRSAVTLEMVSTECCTCGVPVVMSALMMAQRRQDGGTFYCINGHQLGFGDNENARLRKEVEAQKKRVVSAEARASVAEAVQRDAQAERDRLKARVHRGVCPCCNRSFANVQRHMATKHPEATS